MQLQIIQSNRSCTILFRAWTDDDKNDDDEGKDKNDNNEEDNDSYINENNSDQERIALAAVMKRLTCSWL